MKMPDIDYNMVMTVESDPQSMRPKTPGAINGGMLKKDPTATYPILIIDVQDVDAHLAQVKQAGGKVVMPKIEIGQFGFYARVADTEGNIVGIWQERGG